MMNDDLRPGDQVNAKLKLGTTIDWGERQKLIKGEAIAKKLYVEFKEKYFGRELWPALEGKGRQRILIETFQKQEMIAVKLGKWSGSVTVQHRDGDRMSAGDFIDSTFNCPWTGFKSTESKKIFEKETVNTGDGVWRTLAGDNEIESKLTLARCQPSEWGDKKTAECDLKPVKEI